MNINSFNPSSVELKPERIVKDVRSMIVVPKLTVRQKIDQIQIVVTDKCVFEDVCSSVVGEVEKVEFDIIGIDPAVCNTLRRIMLAEVPQMAFERILMYNNTSLIQDEVLAHRLGLIPIKADFRKFKYRNATEMTSINCTKTAEVKEPKEDDTLKFELKVVGKLPKGAAPGDNQKVTSGQLRWIPIGNQSEEMDVKPVFDDIVIAKIKPKQELDIELHAHRGIGRDHAKFSPVCTAFYRLLPTINFKTPITDDDADELKACFSPGTIEVQLNQAGVKEAIVANPRLDSCTREVFRHQKFKDMVELGRVREHALFSVETVGALPPQTIFKEACKVLIEKCDLFLNEISVLQNDLKEETKSE